MPDSSTVEAIVQAMHDLQAWRFVLVTIVGALWALRPCLAAIAAKRDRLDGAESTDTGNDNAEKPLK